MSTQAVALFVAQTQCIGVVLAVGAVLGLIGMAVMWKAIADAPMCDDVPEPKGVSDIRP